MSAPTVGCPITHVGRESGGEVIHPSDVLTAEHLADKIRENWQCGSAE